MTSTKCGFVAIIGAPNAGKSTLLNTLLETKIAAVSPKAQTTRARLRGVMTEGDTQIVFIDTPGIFVPKKRLDRAMVKAAWNEEGDADIVLLMMDASRGKIDPHTQPIIDQLVQQNKRAWLVLNKVDKMPKEKLLPLTEQLHAVGIFDEIFMIAAKIGTGVDTLKQKLLSVMPDGPWHFDGDDLTDMSERLIAAEMTREQLYHQLGAELPYSSTVVTERWEELKDGSVKLEQAIYVERDPQKAIVIGKKGQKIKDIRLAAQEDLQKFLGRPVHLFLFVKVSENWQNTSEHYETWGLEFKS